jgi:hypothetical protein
MKETGRFELDSGGKALVVTLGSVRFERIGAK